MWEWRVFYSESQEPQWASRIIKMLHDTPVEERSDLYYNLRSPELGMKIRAYSEICQMLELKVLQDTKEDFEYWEKPIKQAIQMIESESLLDNIIFSLEKSTQLVIQTKKILEILYSRDFIEIEITKKRKKTSFNNISIESVIIEYQNTKLMGVQLECHSPTLLSQFMQKTLAIPIGDFSNVSYPRFLMGL
ncbi:MAG: hypothetical protein ACTSRE_05455 [Promethearchaeota archaeon]